MKVIIVSRHTALVELILERNLIAEGKYEILSHVTPDQIEGAHVIGVLPLHLAAHAQQVTEIPMDLPPQLRGVELDLETMRKYAGEAVTYQVTRLPFVRNTTL